MASGELIPASRRAQPFQFTLRHLLLLMAACSLAFAAIFQWGPIGFVLVYFGGCVASMIWGIAHRSHVWLERGAVLIILGTILAFMIPSVTSGPPSRRMTCSNHLKQIGLALQNYHDVYGSFPPAYIADASGRPMHSWRVLILPFAEQKPLYDAYRFDEPWDGPNNRKLHNQYPAYFCCPACWQKQPKGETNYVAVVGPDTLWPGEKATSFAGLIDGSSNTIMVVEVHNSGIHWMEPRDLHVTQMPMAVNPPRGQGISSPHPNCALAVFADGHTQALRNDTPPSVLRAALTIAGGESFELP
jgi:hypothetical protein